MKEVTIINPGPSWKECTFQTEELWGSYHCIITPELKDHNYTKLFCLDGVYQSINDHKPIEVRSITKAIDKAKELEIPVVALHPTVTGKFIGDKIHLLEEYPLRPIIKKLKSSYWGPTVTWMIAYALYHDYERIFLYGIDQGPQLAYQTGKARVTFWIGMAMGRGVEVRIATGALKWSYGSGLDSVPIAFAQEEYEDIYRKLESELVDV